MALKGTIKWESRPDQASLLRHQGEGGAQHAKHAIEHTKPHPATWGIKSHSAAIQPQLGLAIKILQASKSSLPGILTLGHH